MSNIVDQFNRLKRLNRECEALKDELDASFKIIGEKIGAGMNDIYDDVYGEQHKHQIPRWVKYYNYVEVHYEDGDIYLWFVEEGRCGNSDEVVHTVTLTESLLTDNGVDEYLVNQKAEITQQLKDKIESTKQINAAQIAALEKQLAKLRGEQ